MAKEFCTVKECCCCVKTYKGAYIIGGLGLLFGLAEVVFCILYFSSQDARIPKSFFEALLIAMTSLNCIVLITDVTMIIGICKRRSGLVLPWFIVKGISVWVVGTFVFYSIVQSDKITKLFAIGISSLVIAILVYCLSVVNSVYVDIKKTNATMEAREAQGIYARAC